LRSKGLTIRPGQLLLPLRLLTFHFPSLLPETQQDRVLLLRPFGISGSTGFLGGSLATVGSLSASFGGGDAGNDVREGIVEDPDSFDLWWAMK
jgi:hypothetical protein